MAASLFRLTELSHIEKIYVASLRENFNIFRNLEYLLLRLLGNGKTLNQAASSKQLLIPKKTYILGILGSKTNTWEGFSEIYFLCLAPVMSQALAT